MAQVLQKYILRPEPWGESPFGSFSGTTIDGGAKTSVWRPSVDIEETKDEYVLTADLPGIRQEDINVTVDDGRLTIQGERRQDKEDKEGTLLLPKRIFGTLTRSLDLPTSVQAEKIAVVYRDGVPSVSVPKVEESEPRKIEVKVWSRGQSLPQQHWRSAPEQRLGLLSFSHKNCVVFNSLVSIGTLSLLPPATPPLRYHQIGLKVRLRNLAMCGLFWLLASEAQAQASQLSFTHITARPGEERTIPLSGTFVDGMSDLVVTVLFDPSFIQVLDSSHRARCHPKAPAWHSLTRQSPTHCPIWIASSNLMKAAWAAVMPAPEDIGVPPAQRSTA
jgi:HSP20 family protein